MGTPYLKDQLSHNKASNSNTVRKRMQDTAQIAFGENQRLKAKDCVFLIEKGLK